MRNYNTLRLVGCAFLPALPEGAAETQATLVQALETARAQPIAASTAVPTATALPPDVVDIGGSGLVTLSGAVRAETRAPAGLGFGGRVMYNAYA